MVSQENKIQHLYLRAGFGETPANIKQKLNTPVEKLVDQLFESSKNYRNLNYMENPVKGKEVSNARILFMILRAPEQMRKMNVEWLNIMAGTNAVLREKMTFFWHDHFATSSQFAWLMQVQNNTLRKHAIGNFGKMLHAISKDQAMIVYLNNQQNKKDHPNENFAREVMELFTLGEGNVYTEKDIKEAARAFTGWTVNKKGQYAFVEKDHDFDEKDYLGRKGKFNAEDIINILLEEKQTARYVTTKIYKEFVHEVPDTDRVEMLTNTFYDSGYDIAALMRTIFTSDWFYDEKNVGSRIASPVELIIRYKKLIGLDFKDDKALTNLQKVLGQTLFFPPNVAGWPGGKNWVDSSTLTLRMEIPKRIIKDGGFDIRPKPEFEDAPEDETKLRTDKKAQVRSDWSKLVHFMRNEKEEAYTSVLLKYLIQSPTDLVDTALIEKYVDHSSPENRIISTAGIIMSLPEFQLI
ncbi:MAG: DUF1800 domain-containing protein [Chitinophagales bacterium]